MYYTIRLENGTTLCSACTAPVARTVAYIKAKLLKQNVQVVDDNTGAVLDTYNSNGYIITGAR